MGAIGSKEKLSQIVAIYGYNCRDFPWKTYDDRNIYHTNGLIINCGGKKYVVTTRSRMIGCSNLVMYYNYFNEKNAVFRNDLHILFQSIEYNLIILGTIGKNEIDFSVSDLVSGEYDANMKCNSYELFDQPLVLPTTRSQYYTTLMDLDLDTATINYNVDIYNAKYNKSFVFDQTYLPANYLYEFKLEKTSRTPISGVYGAIIFNKKQNLVGMITEINGNIIYVLPTKVIHKVVYNFMAYLDKPEQFIFSKTLPFDYRISKKMAIKISNIHNVTNKKNIICEGDKIISINGNETIVIEKTKNKKLIMKAVIYDNDYKNFIPPDIYYRLNLYGMTEVNMVISRKKKTFDVVVPIIPYTHTSFPLTSQPYYFPNCLFPFVNLDGMIIVELTHELIDMLSAHNIVIKNNIVYNYLEDKLKTHGNYLVVIDCTNPELAKKYNLPQWEQNKKQTIFCPTIKEINQKPVSALHDLGSIQSPNSSYELLLMENV